jgi:sulfite exporter TauE/SafE
MIELPLIMLAGLLGSGHCIGMCGPLALTLGAGTRLKVNLQRQIIYSAGRIFTYAFCGAVAAFAGVWLAAHTRSLVVSQAWLALCAGGLLVLVGLASVGLLPRPAIRLIGRAPCGAASAVKTLLSASPLNSVFLAGAATGFLPCGLVYAFLLKAGSAGSPGQGALVMAAFGIGTAPLMVAVGAGGSLLSLAARTRMLRIAGWCVVLTGCVTMIRGAGQLNPPASAVTAPCPLCAATEAG